MRELSLSLFVFTCEQFSKRPAVNDNWSTGTYVYVYSYVCARLCLRLHLHAFLFSVVWLFNKNKRYCSNRVSVVCYSSRQGRPWVYRVEWRYFGANGTVPEANTVAKQHPGECGLVALRGRAVRRPTRRIRRCKRGWVFSAPTCRCVIAYLSIRCGTIDAHQRCWRRQGCRRGSRDDHVVAARVQPCIPPLGAHSRCLLIHGTCVLSNSQLRG